jgi:hypothetical protein
MLQLLNDIPISGQYEEIYFDIDDAWNGQTWNYVLFTTREGDSWVGHFRAHDGKDFKVAELKSTNIVCVVSGGHGYIVDIDQKVKIKDLHTEIILDLKSDQDSNSFFISTYWSVIRIDKNLQEREIDLSVGVDGIYFLNIIDRKLFLKLDEVGTDLETNYDYYIDLVDFNIKNIKA